MLVLLDILKSSLLLYSKIMLLEKQSHHIPLKNLISKVTLKQFAIAEIHFKILEQDSKGRDWRGRER